MFDLENAIANAKSRLKEVQKEREKQEEEEFKARYEKDSETLLSRLIAEIGDELIDDLKLVFEPCNRAHSSYKAQAAFEAGEIRFELWYGGEYFRCFNLAALYRGAFVKSVDFYHIDMCEDELLLAIDRLLNSPRPVTGEQTNKDELDDELDPGKVKAGRINKYGDECELGMTLRQYYIGQAIAVFAANAQLVQTPNPQLLTFCEVVVDMAIEVADKVIEKSEFH